MVKRSWLLRSLIPRPRQHRRQSQTCTWLVPRMEYEKFDGRRWLRRHILSASGSYLCTQLWPALVLLFITLIYGILCVCRVLNSRNSIVLAAGGPGQGLLLEVDPALQPDDCLRFIPNFNHELEKYHEFARKYSDLKIKLLTENDGAPPLRSELPPRPREITIVTQASVDRWPQLEKMVSSWGGAVCVAVHVKTQAQIASVYRKAKSLHKRLEAQRLCRLHLQLVMETGFESENDALAASYPVNALRNVALGMATTDLVFLLDADFVPSPSLHEKLTANESVYLDLLSRTKHARQLLVVPAFQAVAADKQSAPAAAVSDESPALDMPDSLEELRERWLSGSITSFRWPIYPQAHGPTSDSYFMHPLTTEPYHVQYTDFYEPYVIGARAIIPQFDERFRGYGRNKMSHLYKCSFLGMSFVVLPQTYVWEIPHPRTNFYVEYKRQQQDECGRSMMNVLYDLAKAELHHALPT